MWLLLIVFVSGVQGTTELDRFETYEACQRERNRVGYEMADAYPDEHDFNIVCRFEERVA